MARVQRVERLAREWALVNPEWSFTNLAFYIPSSETIEEIIRLTGVTRDWIKRMFPSSQDRKGFVRTLRVICTEGSVGSSEIAEWEQICGVGSAVTVPKEQGGAFRYLVNEREYAIFVRHGENDLRGMLGTDTETIRVLRERFDKEYLEAYVRSQHLSAFG